MLGTNRRDEGNTKQTRTGYRTRYRRPVPVQHKVDIAPHPHSRFAIYQRLTRRTLQVHCAHTLKSPKERPQHRRTAEERAAPRKVQADARNTCHVPQERQYRWRWMRQKVVENGTE